VFEIGASLSAARRAQHLELADVEALTCIGQGNLAALEAERFDVLPGRAYARIFLRTYATALGLDPEPLVAEFEERYPEPDNEILPLRPRRRRAFPIVPLAGITAAAGVVAFVWWSGSQDASRPRSTPPAAASRNVQPHAPDVRPRQTPAATRSGALVIRAVRGDCWLLVRRGSNTGPVLYEATLPEGNSVRFAAPRVWVRFGAPWNVAAQRARRPLRTLPTSTGQPMNLIL
jgi:cytoskeletal protein RodZ